MSKSSQTDLYKEGINMVLDRKYLTYKKMNLWSGPALSETLREDEIETIVDLWKKEKRCPWKLTVQDVSTLVALFFFCDFYFNPLRMKLDSN